MLQIDNQFTNGVFYRIGMQFILAIETNVSIVLFKKVQYKKWLKEKVNIKN